MTYVMGTQQITVICGPTASGKSATALELAEKTDGVIINADSQQLYRDVPTLTARPTPEEEANIPHKLYGILAADESPSVGKWLRLAKMEIDWVLSQGKHPIVTGGTGMYLKALTQGMAEIPDIDESVRNQAENDFEAMGKEAFSERLKAVDPEFFERLKVYDKQRLVRAYSVWLGSGKPLTYWQQQETKPLYPKECFSIQLVTLPREEIYTRCDARFVQMVEQGAVEEVKALLELGIADDASIRKVIGVPELVAYIQGDMELEDAISKAQQATRNYAKRQMTWFRHQLQT